MVWSKDAPEGKESRKVKHMIVPYVRGWGLEIGPGEEKTFGHMLAVDVQRYHGARVAEQVVRSVDAIPFKDATQDFVFSSHCLEHVQDWKKALAEWWRLVRVGGWLVLYLPHKDLYPNMGEPGSNPDHKHDFVNEDITDAMTELAGETGEGWELLEDEVRSKTTEYSFYQVYRKRDDHETRDEHFERKPGKKYALVIRLGDAIGDHIVASSVFPGLRKQGYQVIYNTTNIGYELTQHDPNIAGWWLQDKDEVPLESLGSFWLSLKMEGRWDRIINLCESVEGALLTTIDKVMDTYSLDARRKIIGKVNYLERTHEIADVPLEFAPEVYTTTEEDNAARAWRRTWGGPVIAFPLVGSSFHKVYPWMDTMVAWTLERVPAAKIVLLGDAIRGKEMAKGIVSSILKANSERGKGYDIARIETHCGDWTVRQAIAAEKVCDVVAGPETGMLWAVAMDPRVRKVVWLSHSSRENFGKHWRSLVMIEPPREKVPCFPCHQLHYFHNLTRCAIGITRQPGDIPVASLCTAMLDPDSIVSAVIGHLRAAKLIKAA